MNKTFPALLEYYVTTYTTKELGYSKETLRSYYTCIEQYILWICEKESITVTDINVSHFNKKLIREFLLYIENIKHVSISTRNLRRTALISFLCYLKDVSPIYANAYIEAESIKMKKAPKPDKIFLTIDEYKKILEGIDISIRNGFVHYLIIVVLYDTAARISEAVNMNIEDFSFGQENSVIIYGKGSKYRRVYLTSHCSELIKKYIVQSERRNGPLLINRSKVRISDSGIDYIIKKYAKIASLRQKTVSAHTLRRSKATHMLLNGASLPVIQRFLGHESIQTTQSYLDAGSEAMLKAVENSEKELIDKGVTQPLIDDWRNHDILKRLKMLIKQ